MEFLAVVLYPLSDSVPYICNAPLAVRQIGLKTGQKLHDIATLCAIKLPSSERSWVGILSMT